MAKAVKYKITAKDEASSKIKGVTMSIVKATLAVDSIKTGLKKLVDIGQKSIEFLRVQEQAEKRLETQLGHNIDAQKEYASSLQEITTIGDETILQTMQLASSMGVAEEQLNEATEGAIGLSKAFGIDLNSSMKMVALANEGEYNMLARYIPELRSAKTESEKMAIVQRKMADGFELAKAEAETFTGRIDQLKNKQGDLYESFGGLVSVIGKDFVEGSIKATEALSNFLSSAETIGAVTGGFEVLKEIAKDLKTGVFDQLKDAVDEMLKPFKNMNIEMDVSRVIFNYVATAIKSVSVGLSLATKFIKLVIVAFVDLNEALTQTANLAATFFEVMANPMKWGELKTQLDKTGDSYKEFGKNIVDNTVDLVDTAITEFKGFTTEVEKSASKYQQIWDEANNKVKKSMETGTEIVKKENKNKGDDTEKFLDRLKSSFDDIGKYVTQSYTDTNNSTSNFLGSMLNSFNETFKDIGSVMADKTATAAQKVTAIMQGMLSMISASLTGINSLYESMSAERLAMIEENSESELAAIDERVQRELEMLGLAEETKQEKLQNEIDELNQHLSSVQSTKDRAAIEEQIKEKQKELARQKILDDAENKKEKIRKKAAKKELEEKKKQFEINKALSIANIWINAASAVIGWWSAFATMGIPGIVLAGIMTASTLAMAGVQTGLVASQTFHGADGGEIPNGANSGDRAVTYMNKGEALLRNDDYKALVSMARGDSGGGINIMGDITVVANNPTDFIEQLTEISRYEVAR